MDAEKMLESTIFEFMDLKELKLSKETYECLYYWGCKTIGCLIDMTPKQIQRINGMSHERFTEIVRNLSLMGLVLESDDSEHPTQNRENVKKYPYPANLFVAMNEIAPCLEIKEKYDEQTIVGLSAALASLSPEEETIVLLRYKYCESLSALGRIYDLTHEAVRQKIKKAVYKLMQPPYRNLIECGIDKYIDQQAEERAKEKAKEYLQSEYARGYSDGIEAEKQKQKEFALQGKNPAVLDITIDELGLMLRTYHCLQREGLQTVDDILKCCKPKVSEIKRKGYRRAIDEVGKKLAELGFEESQWDSTKY